MTPRTNERKRETAARDFLRWRRSFRQSALAQKLRRLQGFERRGLEIAVFFTVWVETNTVEFVETVTESRANIAHARTAVSKALRNIQDASNSLAVVQTNPAYKKALLS